MDHAALIVAANGFAHIGVLPRQHAIEAREFLLSRPVYADAHVAQTARNRGEGPTARSLVPQSECVCVHHFDALRAPHLLEAALATIDAAADYLRVDTPVLYSANAFWTRPGPGPVRPDIQDFHQDKDDERFLVLFTYLSDVSLACDGPHELKGPDGEVRAILGPAGTMFLADTSWPHRGLKPKAPAALGERGIAWFRYGVSAPPPAYRWDGLSPLPKAELGDRYPAEPRLQWAMRFLAA